MDARFELRIRCALSLIIGGLIVACGTTSAKAYGVRTANFLVDAPSAQLAQQVADAAEKYRRDLAVYWTGRELPTWPRPCPVSVVAGNHPAQGVTVYNQQPVGDFRMEVIGTPERILDSVLPHEITHTVLATHFGRPLPRWADEGICTTVEHPAEKNKHEIKLREFLNTRRGIPMNKMFLLTEYPDDILPMYAQGYSVCRFLIEQKDARAFVAFLGDYMQNPSWTQNIRKHYGYESLVDLQENWVAWVAAGSGPVDAYVANPTTKTPAEIALVAASLPESDAADRRSPGPTSSAGPNLNAGPVSTVGTVSTVGPIPTVGWYSRTRDGHPAGPAPAGPAPSGPTSSGPTSSGPADGPAMLALSATPPAHRGTTPIRSLPDSVAPLSNTTLPPSVLPAGRYSSVHPQSEQRIARQRMPVKTDQPNAPHFDPNAVRRWR